MLHSRVSRLDASGRPRFLDAQSIGLRAWLVCAIVVVVTGPGFSKTAAGQEFFDDEAEPAAIPQMGAPIDAKPIGAVRADIRIRTFDDEGEPLEVPADLAGPVFREMPPLDPYRVDVVWMECSLAPFPYQFCHQPLYFEDPNLERCGLAHGCCQPLFSAAHFFGTIPLLPYKMGTQHPRELVAATPDCPPGCRYSCADNFIGPRSMRGAVVEGLAAVGLVFLLP